MARVYDFSAYDRYLALKVSPALWLAVLFLFRPYVILALSLANRREPMGLVDLFYADRLPMAVSCLAALPVVLFVLAYLKRSQALDVPWARKIWHRGRGLLAFSAVLNVLVALRPFLADMHHRLNYVGLAQLIIALGVLVYLVRSQRVKDTFADYPDPVKPGA